MGPIEERISPTGRRTALRYCALAQLTPPWLRACLFPSSPPGAAASKVSYSVSSIQRSISDATITRRGKCGFIVPAMTFNPSDNMALAKSLASASVENDFDCRGEGARDDPGRQSLGASTETYQRWLIAVYLPMMAEPMSRTAIFRHHLPKSNRTRMRNPQGAHLSQSNTGISWNHLVSPRFQPHETSFDPRGAIFGRRAGVQRKSIARSNGYPT